MRRIVIPCVIAIVLSLTSTTAFCATRNLIGDWSITFKGYTANSQSGVNYVTVNATIHITQQTGRFYAGTIEFESVPGGGGYITGNIKGDELSMVAANTFFHGKVIQTPTNFKLYLIMETQQMSEDDSQGVVDGTAIRQ